MTVKKIGEQGFSIGDRALPVPSEQLVATDNATILGNGTGAAPLRATGGGGAALLPVHYPVFVPAAGATFDPLAGHVNIIDTTASVDAAAVIALFPAAASVPNGTELAIKIQTASDDGVLAGAIVPTATGADTLDGYNPTWPFSFDNNGEAQLWVSDGVLAWFLITDGPFPSASGGGSPFLAVQTLVGNVTVAAGFQNQIDVSADTTNVATFPDAASVPNGTPIGVSISPATRGIGGELTLTAHAGQTIDGSASLAAFLNGGEVISALLVSDGVSNWAMVSTLTIPPG